MMRALALVEQFAIVALVVLSPGAFGEFQISTNQQHIPSSQEQSHDLCMSDAQCLNGGTCVTRGEVEAENRTARYCRCVQGFSGSRCEDHCPLKCQNHGYCQTGDMRDPTHYYNPNSDNYVCKCKGYLTGKLCNIPYQNCPSGHRCYNGGQCSGSTCTCPAGYSGDTCDDTGGSLEASASDGSSASPQRVVALSIVLVLMLIMLVVVIWLYKKQRQALLYKTVPTAAAANGEGLVVSGSYEEKEEERDNDDDPLHLATEHDSQGDDDPAAVDDSRDLKHRWRNIV